MYRFTPPLIAIALAACSAHKSIDDQAVNSAAGPEKTEKAAISIVDNDTRQHTVDIRTVAKGDFKFTLNGTLFTASTPNLNKGSTIFDHGINQKATVNGSLTLLIEENASLATISSHSYLNDAELFKINDRVLRVIYTDDRDLNNAIKVTVSIPGVKEVELDVTYINHSVAEQ